MIVPCMVNSWLYCSSDRNCRPGRASSARISRAMNPPMKKNANEVTRYRIPIFLASVVRSKLASAEPVVGLCTGHGRVTIGFGATVVTFGPPAGRVVPHPQNNPRPGLRRGRGSLRRGRRSEGEPDGTGGDRREYQQDRAPGDQPLRRGQPGQPAAHVTNGVAGRRRGGLLLGRRPVEPGPAQDRGGSAEYQQCAEHTNRTGDPVPHDDLLLTCRRSLRSHGTEAGRSTAACAGSGWPPAPSTRSGGSPRAP